MKNKYELLLGILILFSIIFTIIEPGILVAITIGIIITFLWIFILAYLETKYHEFGGYLGYVVNFIFIITIFVIIFPFIEIFTKEWILADIFLIVGLCYPSIILFAYKS